MKRITIFQIAYLSTAVIFYSLSYAQEITSVELINNAKNYDGKSITYKGEVIGDIMVRSEYAWLSVNDGFNAIGIWAKRGLTNSIQYTGNFKSKGDIVGIEGIFNRACPEHGGELDIHAKSIIRIIPGYRNYVGVSGRKMFLCAVSFLFILLIGLVRFRYLQSPTNKHPF